MVQRLSGTGQLPDNNGLGMIGVAPEAKILPVKVLADDSGGALSWIIAGIVYATDQGADVINMR
jgi:subtilisin family serine protease